nr:hypothetical protein [Nocardia abscessus]
MRQDAASEGRHHRRYPILRAEFVFDTPDVRPDRRFLQSEQNSDFSERLVLRNQSELGELEIGQCAGAVERLHRQQAGECPDRVAL